MLVLVHAVVFLQNAGEAATGAANRPNIVFILADDLGINDLRCYGRTEHRTPNLDRLAAEGTRFTCAYAAQPICSPSRAAILSGKAPARLHLTTYLPGRPDCVSQKLAHPKIRQELPLEEKTIAEYLKEAGYVTGCIGKWHVGGKGFGPLEQGFDSYHAGKPNTQPSATEGGKGEYDLTAAAERFIETNRNRPFFLYLAHNSPHIPYAAKTNLVEKNHGSYEPVYAALIETLDDAVGRVVAKVDALGLATNTIVIFTSDNGGLHIPEGRHQRITHNRPYRAGKGFVYEGGLRIPLIVRAPGVVPRQVVETPVINTDWLPTLLTLCGQKVPANLDGVSFAGMLLGDKEPAPQRRLFWHFPHYTNQGSRPAGAVREGFWKLIEHYETGKVELYDVSSDLGERNDRSGSEPEVTARLRQALAEWRVSVGAQVNTKNEQFEPAEYRAIYEDIDVSRYNGSEADQATFERVLQWRKDMDRVVRDGEALKRESV